MTDKEALEHILRVADDYIKVFDEIPVDSVEHMAKYAGKHIVAMVEAISRTPDPIDGIMSYATAIAGLVIRLKAGLYASALLAAEEASNEST